MPLPPRHGVGRIECRHDRQRRAGRFSVHIQADASTAVRSVKQIPAIDSCVGNLNSQVEPLFRHGPADIKLVLRWKNEVVLRVVDFVVEFGIGGVDTFMHAELIQLGSVRGVKGAAAIIFRVRIVIGDAFAAKVIESALHLAGNWLRSGVVAAVVVRLAFISVEKIYSCRTHDRAGKEARQCEEQKPSCMVFCFICLRFLRSRIALAERANGEAATSLPDSIQLDKRTTGMANTSSGKLALLPDRRPAGRAVHQPIVSP